MFNKTKSLLAALVVAAGAFALSPAQAAVPESKDPIKLAVNEWTGQHLSTYIYGALLEKMGYNVEYVTAGAVPQYAAMASGNLTANPENWDNNVGDIYPKAVASGDLVIVGKLGLQTREGWIYPPYMEEKCPGLPDWKALFKCPDAFGTPETFPKGRLITYPADWGTRSKDFVEANKMPFVPVPGGSEGAMIAELKSAVAAKEPVLMMFWAPHWIFAQLDFNWVELPPYEEGCDDDPKVGPNPNAVHDCGFVQATVNKVAWKGMKDKWPGAYKLMQAYTLTNKDQNAMMLEVDNKGRDAKVVAKEWVDAHEAMWQPWIDAAKK
jgi:glycine betaine/proline transport system substrate-binding protein